MSKCGEEEIEEIVKKVLDCWWHLSHNKTPPEGMCPILRTNIVKKVLQHPCVDATCTNDTTLAYTTVVNKLYAVYKLPESVYQCLVRGPDELHNHCKAPRRQPAHCPPVAATVAAMPGAAGNSIGTASAPQLPLPVNHFGEPFMPVSSWSVPGTTANNPFFPHPNVLQVFSHAAVGRQVFPARDNDPVDYRSGCP